MHKDYLKNIFKIGYPYSLQRLIFSQIGLMLTAALVQFGDAAMAAQRLAFQIESVTLLVLFGLLTATSAFSLFYNYLCFIFIIFR